MRSPPVRAITNLIARARAAAGSQPLEPVNRAAAAEQRAAELAEAKPYPAERILAGHVLRRLGFGPTKADLDALERADLIAYIDEQINPDAIDDSAAEAKFYPGPANSDSDEFGVGIEWIKRWYTRMVYSRKQLQEKMTLIWHEHFSVAFGKLTPAKIHRHEELLRRDCLGSFSQMLVDVTIDPGMLVWLDNSFNDGNAVDADGNRIPPNENYARELLQLFSIGPVELHMDGTPVLGPDGIPLPSFTEDDVKAVARALTGWHTDVPDEETYFDPARHDSGEKLILGERLAGRQGQDGAQEVQDVVGILMRQPSMAPFIAKELIQKLATETPTPGYVERVATVFRATNADLRQTVRAIATDPEFTSAAVMRSQYKLPVEAFVGIVRALEGVTEGDDLVATGFRTEYLVFRPPSVFSFYRPGDKRVLANSSLLLARNTEASRMLMPGAPDSQFDFEGLARTNRLTTPKKAVAFLSDVLLAAPLEPGVRKEVIKYMNGQVSDQKLRGAAWLIVASPEFLLN